MNHFHLKNQALLSNRRWLCSRWIIAILLLTCISKLHSQTSVSKEFNLKDGDVMAILVDSSGEYQDTIPNPWDSLRAMGIGRYIIQLRTPSVAEYKALNPGATPAQLQAHAAVVATEQANFIQDLNAIEDALVNANIVPYKNINVHQVYGNVLNGLAVHCWAVMRRNIVANAFVKALEEDATIVPYDAASFAAVNLPCFQSTYGAFGSGIDIGIIDTGVDANHPELGGGYGMGFKVNDWFDFAAGSPVPVDVNGHGTHVAGIAASLGPLQPGMAPAANITGYRVFNNFGFGSISWVIQALNRSVDPNMDLVFTDRLDVVNLSLGAPGSALSLMSVAADNATTFDVVVVAAIGNSGPGWYTASSPGVAQRVIGVGACDNGTSVMSFSSRGPGTVLYNLKPDIMAPGYLVVSTWLGFGFTALSGTSMSAPHVAGAAALLRELYPARTPDEIKAMLMQTATSLGAYNFFTQGAGKLNLCTAAAQTCAVTPASWSLGMYPCGSPSWTNTQTFTVHNYDIASHVFSLSTSAGTIPAGVTTVLSPTSLTIPAGGSATFNLTVTVPNASASGIPPVPCFIGYVNVSTTGCSETIPFSYAKYSGIQQINFDISPWLVAIHNGSSLVATYVNPPTTIFPLLPPGTYDIMAVFPDVRTRVVVEGVVITGSCPTPVDVFSTFAVNDFPILETDIGGTTLAFQNIGASSFLFNPVTMGYLFVGGFSQTLVNPHILKTNSYSNRYRVDLKVKNQTSATGWSYYDYAHRVIGPITGGYNLTVAPTDFTPMPSTLHAWPGTTAYYVMENPQISSPNLLFWFWSWGGGPIPGLVVNSPWVDQTAYYSPNPASSPYYFHPRFSRRHVWDISGGWLISNSNVEYEHAFTSGGDPTYGSGLFLARDFDFSDATYHNPGGTTIHCGSFAPRWNGRCQNSVSGVNTTLKVRLLPQFGWFADQTGDIRRANVPWTVLNSSGTPIASGSLQNINTVFGPSITTLGTFSGLGAYSAVFTYSNYEINGMAGVATTTLSVNSASSTQPNAPWLHKMYLRSNELPAEMFNSANHNELIFQVRDEAPFSGFSNIQASYRLNGSFSWTNLPLSYDAVDDVYHGDFPCNLATGHYDVKIIAKTNNGQKLEHEMVPAFYFTNSGTSTPGWSWVEGSVGPGSQLTRSVAHDGAGNVVTTGDYDGTVTFTGTGNVFTPAGGAKNFVAKYTPAGTEIWQITSTGAGANFGQGIAVDASDNMYVVGSFKSNMTMGAFTITAVGSDDAYIAKISPSGTVLWLKGFGSTAADRFWDVAVDAAGQVYVTGVFSGTFTAAPLGSFAANASGDVTTMSISSAGVPAWVALNVSSNLDKGRYITVDGTTAYVYGDFTGNFTIASTSMLNPSNTDGFVVRYNSSTGAPLSAFQISSTNNVGINGISVNGGRMTVGANFTNSCVINGTSVTATGVGNNGLVANLMPAGPIVFAYAVGGSNPVSVGSVTTTPSGESEVGFNFVTSLTITSLPTVTTLTGTGQVAIAKYSASGTPLSLFASVATVTGCHLTAMDMSHSPLGKVAICGFHSSPAVGGSNFGADNLLGSVFQRDLWVADAFSGCPTFPWTGVRIADPSANPKPEVANSTTTLYQPSPADDVIPSEMGLDLWPNPAQTKVSIRLRLPEEGKVSLTVVNLVGEVVADMADAALEAGSTDFVLDRQALGLPDGVYFVRLLCNGESHVKKLVLQH